MFTGFPDKQNVNMILSLPENRQEQKCLEQKI